MLAVRDLDFPLPEDLIATHPVEPRDAARLLVIRRSRPDMLEDRVFRDLDELLEPNDLLVVNATRVLPARFRGVRADTGGHAEGLYLGPAPAADSRPAGWQCLFKMRRAKPGVRVALLRHDDQPADVELLLLDRLSEDGVWHALPCRPGSDQPLGEDAPTLLSRVGLTPIPPYILAARKARQQSAEDARDAADYQTVYAHAATSYSVAAPTAGLHFTPALLDRLEARGVNRTEVLLDVGMGTFKPVETEFVEHHPMHAEFCCVPPPAIQAIHHAKAAAGKDGGGRVVAVGTTAARTLESFDDPRDLARRGPTGLHTRLLITPGWRWRSVDALITNFHLPKTTLLAMVAALLHDDTDPRAGVERLRAIYAHAVRERYRFYSFGDAMIILP